jgi:catechol 2,3-dioxygenase
MTDDPFFRSAQFTELTLRVADLAHVQAFYEDVLGFARLATQTGSVALAPPGAAQALVVLHAAPDAAPRPRGAAGLFHVAFLFPDRAALARALRRVLDLDVPIGSADHGVSEAIYLSDPEGNGIELYADRPQEAWPPRLADGQVTMYTDALDIPALLALARPSDPLLPKGTRIGHVHLSVADLGHAEHFYGEALGFGVTQRSYPGALFLGRDGYHHHIAANIWRSHRAAVPGTIGLAEFTLRLSPRDDFAAITTRLAASGHLREKSDDIAVAHDLDGLVVRLVQNSGQV